MLAAAAAGCARKDCVAYAEHLAKLAAPERASSVRLSARQSCDNGRVMAEQIACTLRAKDSSAAYACHRP